MSFSSLEKDPRVLRQSVLLGADFDIIAAGYGSCCKSFPLFIQLSPPQSNPITKLMQAIRLKCNQFETYYWNQPHVANAWNKLKDTHVDIILANDLNSLPLAARLAEKIDARLFLDVHEYEPRHFEGTFLFDFFFKKLWDYVAITYLPRIHGMSTVCDGISRLYEAEYGVRPTVITNAPYQTSLTPSATDPDCLRIIHHGICTPYRGIEEMIDLVDLLDQRFYLDLMLVNVDAQYYSYISERIDDNPRVSLKTPVLFDDIIPTINAYDIGLCMFSNSTPTLQHALPNKFFEFIQAKLCICSYPTPEMEKIISTYGCGRVSEEHTIEAMAKVINRLTASDITRMKTQAIEAAMNHCAENNKKLLLDIVERALSATESIQ